MKKLMANVLAVLAVVGVIDSDFLSGKKTTTCELLECSDFIRLNKA